MEEFSDERDYFYPYAFLSDQRQMLMDAARMDAYHTAIHGNPSHFRGKAVLDCGTGTGVLAIWAAKAGARVVYAVEATDVARHTRTLVAANGVADVVKVIQGRIEDVELPEKVDTIVSEWMGLLLLRDGMLNSVLAARDKWLVPGGALFPSHCALLLAPTAYTHGQHGTAGSHAGRPQHSEVMAGWQALVGELAAKYGVDYSCLTSALAAEGSTYHLQGAIEDILGGGGSEGEDGYECEVWEGSGSEADEPGTSGAHVTALPSRWTSLSAADVLSQPAVIKEFDCHSVTAEHLAEFTADFAFNLKGAPANSLTAWFDVHFNGGPGCPADTPVTLSTAPAAAPTHWGQQTFELPGPSGAGVLAASQHAQLLRGAITVARLPATHRMYDVRLELETSNGEAQEVRESLHYSIE
eukprot:jgi/Tetstr1/426242/TSEL_016562.t1